MTPPLAQHGPTSERNGGISGKIVVFATLSLFFIIPVMTYFIWSMTQGEAPRVKLDYEKRAEWFIQYVKPRPLTYNTFVAAETGKTYKKTDLYMAPEVEQVILRCVKLAQQTNFFEDETVPDTLLPLAEDQTLGFYPAYLLASYYEVNGNAQEQARWQNMAYDRAGGAIVQRLVDEAGQPVAGYRTPPVAIGYDRVIEGERNANLVLVYPAPISEADGFVYLPTYRSVYRLTDAGLPPGVDPGIHPILLTFLPQPAKGEQPNWFAVPDGAVGRLPDGVVSREKDQ